MDLLVQGRNIIDFHVGTQLTTAGVTMSSPSLNIFHAASESETFPFNYAGWYNIGIRLVIISCYV